MSDIVSIYELTPILVIYGEVTSNML
jgi:hypothetical protein